MRRYGLPCGWLFCRLLRFLILCIDSPINLVGVTAFKAFWARFICLWVNVRRIDKNGSMWLLACSVGVSWASVQRGKLARFAPAPCMAFGGAFSSAVVVCPCMQRLKPRRVLWWLLGLLLRLASASCQHFGADRLGVVCPWDPRRGFCSSNRVTVSGILGGSSFCWGFCLGSWECGAVFC